VCATLTTRSATHHPPNTDLLVDTTTSPYPNDGLSIVEYDEASGNAGDQLPQLEQRLVKLDISNPFLINGLCEHPRLLSNLSPVPVSQVHVSGLIKFRLQFEDPKMPQKTREILAKHQRKVNDQMSVKPGQVSYLPKDFGRGLNLDDMDTRLLKSCELQ
jgi:hypothetical protein